jgi:hypothetical protein
MRAIVATRPECGQWQSDEGRIPTDEPRLHLPKHIHAGGRSTSGRRIGWRSSWVRRFGEENHPVLQVIDNTGEILWLGVRDDFRNWLLTAA